MTKWILALLLAAPAARASDADPCAGPWTLLNQQPARCYPYPNSIWAQPLPSDILSHIASNSTAVVNQMRIGMGGSSFYGGPATPGGSDGGHGTVYGQASDPYWKVSAAGPYKADDCSGDGDPGNVNYACDVPFHIPNNAHFSQAWNEIPGADNHLVVYDQGRDEWFALYNTYHETSIGTCSGYTPETACSIPITGMLIWKAPRGATGASTYQLHYAGQSLENAPSALTIRHQELIEGNIPHAIYLDFPCENPGSVFPAIPGDHCSMCSDFPSLAPWVGSPSNMPKHGDHFFVDYTDAQIAAMNISAPEKTVLKALARYGGYEGDTSTYWAVGTGNYESLQPFYDHYGYAWDKPISEIYNAHTIPIVNYLMDNGIQPWGGGGPGTNESVGRFYWILSQDVPDFWSHVHIADPCVALGFAGLPGGCGTLTEPTKCDLSGDGSVDTLDLQRLANAILRADSNSIYDVNRDQAVNVLDLQTEANVVLGKTRCP